MEIPVDLHAHIDRYLSLPNRDKVTSIILERLLRKERCWYGPVFDSEGNVRYPV